MSKRLTFDFGDEALKRLERLRLECDADNVAEVLRSALRLYEAMIAQSKTGKKLYEEDPQTHRLEEFKVFE